MTLRVAALGVVFILQVEKLYSGSFSLNEVSAMRPLHQDTVQVFAELLYWPHYPEELL